MSPLRRALWTALLLLGLHLVAVSTWACITPRAEPGALMPAAGGAVDELAIQFHREGKELFLPVFGQLLASLDPDTVVHVVVADGQDREIFEAAYDEWFADGDGPTLSFAEAGQPITSWMRDRLAVLPSADGPTTLLAPVIPMTGPEARAHDWLVPWTLGEHLGDGVIVRRSLYRFDGGDLIADEERVYVATPLFERNPAVDPMALIGEVEADVRLPVLALSDTPDHHIGMFLTPLGDGRVAVGDPDLGLAIAREAGLDPANLQVGGLPLTVDTSTETLERFRGVARQLEEAGLEVVPIPLLPSTRPWVWMSYNNLLAEHRGDGRLHLVLPTYGVEALDSAAVEAWEAQGAVVHPVRVESIFRLGGSVRCVVAPVGRSGVGGTV